MNSNCMILYDFDLHLLIINNKLIIKFDKIQNIFNVMVIDSINIERLQFNNLYDFKIFFEKI